MEARPRLFVALMLGRELGAEVARRVEEATATRASARTDGSLRRYAPGLRRYAPGDLHLTLFFLGATDAALVEPLGRTLAELAIRHGPLELRLTRAGAFPAPGRERVLWLGVDEVRPGGLARLAGEVAGACVELGARAEERPWRAHVTVARVRERARSRVPGGFYDLDLGLEWKPKRLQLVESSAGREPSNEQRESYRVVAEFELASR